MLILDSGHPAQAVQNLVRDGLVEGVIIAAEAVGNRWVDELIDARMPTILIGSHPHRPEIPEVTVECRESSARMVGHLLDSGCRRVGTITGPLDRVDALLRHDGYLAAHRRRGLTPDPSLTFESNYTYAGGRLSVDRMLDREVDGVFAANDQMAMAVLDRAIERGIDIPRQLSIAGFDGIARDLPARMTLSTVEQPLAELGSRAVAGLVDLINGLEVPDRQVLEPRLILGSTTGPGGTDPSRRAPGVT
jgi:LacI family transcriptional regulator